jgi:hypothetical protein
MTPTLETAAQSSEIITRMLVTIYPIGEPQPFRFVANDNQDLTMPNGDLYMSADIKRGDINTALDGDKEQVALTLSNRWLQWGQYIAQNKKKLKGARCVIEEVFLDHLAEGVVWRYEGVTNKVRASMSEFNCVVERDTVDYTQDGPALDYGPTCQFTFGDSRCRSTNPVGPCDQTSVTCDALGNITRYQGHLSIPREMVMRG